MRQGGPDGQCELTKDFKRDAVVQITEQGYPIAEVAARLGISKYSLYEWRKRYGNPTRKHARNGRLSPIEFERQHKATP
ncbi:hypothetical protein XFLAVUS301_33450 [Xanthobacter flavus]|uniref:Transposase n=1 Tax=Xanthobacter flavus TaxID=281 RepID=A0A9W6FKT6_XANFL|nr:hypothetical protein XFLAVUS301_33450 [Xanthobacter flavus]